MPMGHEQESVNSFEIRGSNIESRTNKAGKGACFSHTNKPPDLPNAKPRRPTGAYKCKVALRLRNLRFFQRPALCIPHKRGCIRIGRTAPCTLKYHAILGTRAIFPRFLANFFPLYCRLKLPGIRMAEHPRGGK